MRADIPRLKPARGLFCFFRVDDVYQCNVCNEEGLLSGVLSAELNPLRMQVHCVVDDVAFFLKWSYLSSCRTILYGPWSCARI